MKKYQKIILITIDALRQDSLSCYGYSKPTSPFLDQLAQQGTQLRKAFATGSFTPASFPSILASIYPLQYGDYLPLPSQAITLAETFQKNSFQTGAFLSNAYTSRYYGYNKGFHHFQDYLTYQKINKIKTSTREKLVKTLQKNWLFFNAIENVYSCLKLFFKPKSVKPNEEAPTITEDAIEWIQKNKDQNFFLWLHYMDVHTPYFPPKEYRKKLCPHISKKEMYQLDLKIQRAVKDLIRMTPEEVQKLKDLYDAAINYVDDHIKKLVDYLKSENLYQDTLIVITADHGEEFYDDDDLYHKSKPYDFSLNVPLILSQKFNIPPNKLISLVDLPPTLTNFAGLPLPATWQGIDFLQQDREFVYFEDYHNNIRWLIDDFIEDKEKYFLRGIRTKNFKYAQDDLEGELLFDLKKDPQEKTNLILNPEYQKIKDCLRKTFRNFLQEKSPSNSKPFEENKKEKFSKEDEAIIKERLQKLGYL